MSAGDVVRRWLTTENVRVTNDRAALRRLLTLSVMAFLVGLVSLTLVQHADRIAVRVIGSSLLCGMIGLFAAQFWLRAEVYRKGWVEGRMNLLFTLLEASRRGMNMREFIEAELSHIKAVTGGVVELTITKVEDDEQL